MLNIYLVGGAVRDRLLGVEPKDFDFAVEYSGDPMMGVQGAFREMENQLMNWGFQIFQSLPEYGTIKAKMPGNRVTCDEQWWDPYIGLTADFVLCRKDGPSADGRRPDYVSVGTIQDDLARRDFTMNAMARNVETGALLDPFCGEQDLAAAIIRFVGDPWKRIAEDGLRVMRALRFMATMDLEWPDMFDSENDNSHAMHALEASEMLMKVSVERIREELVKVSNADKMFEFLMLTTGHQRKAIFRDGLRLVPSLKK